MNVFEKIKEKIIMKLNYSSGYPNCSEYDYAYECAMSDARKQVIEIVEQVEKQCNNCWIPCSERFPDTDKYILLSFSNFSIPLVGRYEEDEDGSGSFYIGDEMETCLSQDLFVNAWQPLPEPYKESEKE